MSIQELNLQLKNYFESKDFTYVDLPLVFDSDVFYEMSGEILRKQMYSFYDNSGNALEFKSFRNMEQIFAK